MCSIYPVQKQISSSGNGMLEAQELVKEFRGGAGVHSLSMVARAGTIVGLLGPNGAGKTTFFYMLAGLIPPDRGKIYFKGEEVTCLPAYMRARLGMGYLPQEPSIFGQLSVEDNIRIALEAKYVKKGDKSRIDHAFERVLEEFDLCGLRQCLGIHLSGGQRRRVEIARLMAIEPEFVFLDEPFSGIDPKIIVDVKKTIVSLRNRCVGIILSDHNAREAIEICDYLYIVDRGRMLTEGCPGKILKDPLVRERYLGQHFNICDTARE